MGIRQGHIEENTKNLTIVLESNNFKDIGYWIRDVKKKVKKFEILKIKIILNVSYFDEGYYEEDES